MPRGVIYLRSGSNSQSVFICVILKPLCRYNLCTCVIPSSMLSTFWFLSILSVANMMCPDMVLRNTIPFMCMRSQQMVTFLYLSRMVLGTLVILIGSTCWILCRTVLPFMCGMIGPHISSYILTSSSRIGRFCRMLSFFSLFFSGLRD